jgi:hypothetical protein
MPNRSSKNIIMLPETRNQGDEQSTACMLVSAHPPGGKRATMLVSAHPSGGKSSSTFVTTKGDQRPTMCCHEIQYAVRSS